MTVDPSAVTAAEPAAGAATTAPTTVGKYRLDRVIGSGGMGIVWAAFDPDLERSVALKLLHAESTEPTLRSRLLREARAMARLRHPNVVTVFEVGTDQNRDYIAMELVEGGTLDAWFETKPTRAQLVEALLAAGKGLAAAHAAGLVHRDFKPHNVLRANDGHIYVTDFGLARGQIEDGGDVVQLPAPTTALDSGRRKLDSVLDSPLTQTGVLIGTPAYMAPEQFAGRMPDPKSDQFAFCVTAWEAFTGARPFRGGTLAELEAAARAGVLDESADVPASIRAVLARGLDPAPAARWPDMTSLLTALADAYAEPVRPRSKRRFLLPVIAGVVVLGGATAAIVITQRGSHDAETDCTDPDAAFSRAWSNEHRGALMKNHAGGEAIGAVAILDETRRWWVRSYTATCALPAGSARTTRLQCLDNARNEISRVLERITPSGAELDVSAIAGQAALVVLCDPNSQRDGDGIEPPEPPEPPEAPTGLPGHEDDHGSAASAE
jgi:serine/threonine protein kinase